MTYLSDIQLTNTLSSDDDPGLWDEEGPGDSETLDLQGLPESVTPVRRLRVQVENPERSCFLSEFFLVDGFIQQMHIKHLL